VAQGILSGRRVKIVRQKKEFPGNYRLELQKNDMKLLKKRCV